MAKRQYIDYKKMQQELFSRTEGYAAEVRKIYMDALGEIINLVKGTELEDGKPFSFSDYGYSDEVTPIFRNMYSRTYQIIKKGVEKEWNFSNDNTDALVKSIFGAQSIEDNHFARFFNRNKEAMDAFFARKTGDGGLNLSQKVWRYTGMYKSELEDSLELAIGEGTPANRLATKIKEYLQDPDKFYRRFRVKIGEDEDGNPVYGRKWKRRIWDREADSYRWIDDEPRKYHPGNGVYRSSYRNAQRLARTETNMAYRTADYERWQQLDFVVGIEIKLSNNHPCTDICDDLKGVYPKDFKWTGWHPNCRCYQVPALATDKEMDAMLEKILDGEPTSSVRSENETEEMPEQFKAWMEANKERVEKATKRGTLPYFIKDNQSVISETPAQREAKKQAVVRTENQAKIDGLKNVLGTLLPKGCASTLKELEAINANNGFDEFNSRIDLLNRAVERHEQRTSEQADAILKEWYDRKATRKYGNAILDYMNGISDVDVSDLAKVLKGGDMDAILKEAYSLKSIGKQILALDKLDNPMEVARKYSMADAVAVNNAVTAKLKQWETLTLEQQAKKLNFEIDWCEKTKKYSTWEVAQAAYVKELVRVNDLIEWQTINSAATAAKAFTTKSQIYKNLLSDLDAAIASKDKSKANAIVADLQSKKAELEKAAAKRNAKKGISASEISFDADAYSKERKDAALWFKEASDANDYFFDNAKEMWALASDGEKGAMYQYTAGSSYITEPLRAIKGYYHYYTGRLKESERHIEGMTNYIARSSFKNDVWIKRDEIAAFMEYRFKLTDSLNSYIGNESKLVGMIGTDDSFMSCGSCKRTNFGSKPVVLNIYCPKGTKATYAEPFSAFGCKHDNGVYQPGKGWNGASKPINTQENEIILQRGTKFRITKAEYTGGKWYIDLEVLSQSPKVISEMVTTSSGFYCKFE